MKEMFSLLGIIIVCITFPFIILCALDVFVFEPYKFRREMRWLQELTIATRDNPELAKYYLAGKNVRINELGTSSLVPERP